MVFGMSVGGGYGSLRIELPLGSSLSLLLNALLELERAVGNIGHSGKVELGIVLGLC